MHHLLRLGGPAKRMPPWQLMARAGVGEDAGSFEPKCALSLPFLTCHPVGDARQLCNVIHFRCVLRTCQHTCLTTIIYHLQDAVNAGDWLGVGIAKTVFLSILARIESSRQQLLLEDSFRNAITCRCTRRSYVTHWNELAAHTYIHIAIFRYAPHLAARCQVRLLISTPQE